MAKPTKTQTLNEILNEADTAMDVDALKAAQAKLRKLMAEGFVKAEAAASPFSAAVEMTDAFRQTYIGPEQGSAEAGFGSFIGGIAVDAANAIANAERRVAYRLKVLFGFTGLRIVEEGDSWTQYPIFLEDIADHLSDQDDIAIYSVGAAGDLINDMAARKEYLRALKRSKADIMVLSGGGNDLFGDLRPCLFEYQDGSSPADLINEPPLDAIFDGVMSSYREILSDVAQAYPHVMVFGHGYDLPFPDADGKWIGPALSDKNIPFDVGREVIKLIMDRFNVELAALAAQSANFVYCDLRGEVDRGSNSWYDELHPKNAGYGRAAAVIENKIRQYAQGAGEAHHLIAAAGTGGAEAGHRGRPTIVLDPGHGGTVALGGSSANNAVGPRGTLEKTLTLDVARRTRDILEDRGFEVLLTRDRDVNVSLAGRAAVSKTNNAAAFVSVHFNGSRAHNAQGTETFVHSSLRTRSPSESKALCRAVQTEMVAALGLRDRNAGHAGGIKYGGFGVLKPSRHAGPTGAILHEVSFLDRVEEEARLGTVSYRRKIATALADGIETFVHQTLGAETARLEMAEVEDAFALAATEAAPDFAGGTEALPAGALERPAPVDFSNGHLIAGSDMNDDFITALAAHEARYLQQGSGGQGLDNAEGEEPSEYDPNVEATFSNMRADVGHNAQLLRSLFGGVESSSFDHAAFESFIANLGLRHFSASEFLVMGGQHASGPCAGKNSLPPKSLWHRLANTARMIDEIRARLNAPVFINSAYRSPDYNTCIDGATYSQHMNFNALDWRCSAGTPSDWARVARQVRASNPNFAGYIKQYSSFVHIDTRDA